MHWSIFLILTVIKKIMEYFNLIPNCNKKNNEVLNFFLFLIFN